MVRFASPMPPRPRTDRARRRVTFFAESLESRQLLSVAAVPPTIAPLGNVPAAVGPVATSPSANAGNAGSAGASAGVFSFPVANVTIIEGELSRGFVEIIEIPEVPSFSLGLGTTAPTSSGLSSSPSTPSTATGTSTTGGSTSVATSPTAVISPLTATVVTTPGSANRGLVVAVVTPQPIVVPNLTPSTIPVTTQAVLATAAQEEQPLAPPVLGQGFESGQTQGIDPRFDRPLIGAEAPVPLEPQFPGIDIIEPRKPAVEIAPENQPAEPPAVPAIPAIPDEAGVIPDQAVEVANWGKTPEFPILSPQNDARAEVETPSLSLAAMIGTAAIAGGGYHLVLGGSSRFNQRWIPARRSPKARGRKPVAS